MIGAGSSHITGGCQRLWITCWSRRIGLLWSITRGMDLWTLQDVSGSQGTLRLPSIECDLPLATIYARIAFAPGSRLPDEAG